MISTILRQNNYRQLTASATGHMREQWPMHGNNAYQRKSEAAANSMTAWK